MRVHLYVEGGGDSKALRTKCREGFRGLIERSGLGGRMPRITASGSRGTAYRDFCTASRAGDARPMLLVDAEARVTTGSPWQHVKGVDGWPKPKSATDDQLHLMVQCMESWFLADRRAVAAYFGEGFREGALLAPTRSIESIAKKDLFTALAAATRSTKTKGAYGKGAHSFDLLGRLDPALVRAASPWADRFFVVLGAWV